MQQSGLIELRQFVRNQFRTRATTLKVRGVLLALEKLIRDNPRDGVDEIRAGIERISADRAHAARTLAARDARGPMACRCRTRMPRDAQRIIGGKGTLAHVRLGLPEDADDETMRGARRRRSSRTGARSPSLRSRSARRSSVCRVVIRSLDEMASEVPRRHLQRQRSPPPMTPSWPRRTSCCRADQAMALGRVLTQQGEQHQSRLRRKKKTKRVSTSPDRHPLH